MLYRLKLANNEEIICKNLNTSKQYPGFFSCNKVREFTRKSYKVYFFNESERVIYYNEYIESYESVGFCYSVLSNTKTINKNSVISIEKIDETDTKLWWNIPEESIDISKLEEDSLQKAIEERTEFFAQKAIALKNTIKQNENLWLNFFRWRF